MQRILETWGWVVVCVVGASLAVDAAPSQTPAVTIPSSPEILVDGTWGDGEWDDSSRTGDAQARLAVSEANGFVQIGVLTSPLFVASICLAVGDTVHVFHASSALGHAAYVRDGSDWKLRDGFEWRLRNTDLDEAASQERLDHRKRYGWVANTVAMGAAGETEFQISVTHLGASGARLAIGLLLAGEEPEVDGWPLEEDADGCTLRSVIAGPLPERAEFRTDDWLRIERSPDPE